jgi:hypothetical protein
MPFGVRSIWPARATLDALRRLLLRESQEQPLLLVFEDLHWIDAETQALLDSLVEALPTARILLLVDYRPEYTHAWANKSYYTQLRWPSFSGRWSWRGPTLRLSQGRSHTSVWASIRHLQCRRG